MKLFIEEHSYKSERSKSLLKKILNFEQGDAFNTDMVGYYYSNDVKDTVFFLPKVVMDKEDRVFGKYDPEEIIDLQQALESNKITTDEYNFIYGLSVWIYRAISVFRKTADDNHRKILLYRDIPSDDISGQYLYNTFLDILISMQRFNDQNQNYFTFVLKDIHSGFNKINWTKTISRSQAVIQNDVPIYTNVINRKRLVNLDEELFIIFFSILRHIQDKYGFPVKINYNFPLITDDEFERYLEGYGEIRLIQIRHKYFADKQVQMWQLCYDFFTRRSQISNSGNYSDHLLAKDFNIVFEAMIDHLLSDKDERIERMRLKEQTDGKRVDHIYAWTGLMHNENDIFYIGDSKYYKQANNPEGNSIYKQYTYARNVIQANLDLFNQKDANGKRINKPGEDYLIYRDDDTEGYNITPNFFIRAHVPSDRSYEDDDLQEKGDMEKKIHFENRLFDRDTLLLQHYDINFLYVLSVYGSENAVAQKAFKQKARIMFRDKIMEDIEKEYDFFSLQLKPYTIEDCDDEDEEGSVSNVDRMNRLVEQKYFHRLLGKAFRPYKEEEFLYLSLESKPEYYQGNMKLLADLSQDFNIRHYNLGTDPTDTINSYANIVYASSDSTGRRGNASNAFKYIDFKDEIFLVGGFRSGDKDQQNWIIKNMMYNVRANAMRHGFVDSIIDDNAVSARFLILYEINDSEKREYHVYRISSLSEHSENWMKQHGYQEPNGKYLVYKLEQEDFFEIANVNNLLLLGLYDEIKLRKGMGKAMPLGWIDEEWKGSPIFLKGQQISSFALASHRKTENALVVVDINDRELSKLKDGFSAEMFVADKTLTAIENFLSASHLIYSNKTSYKAYKILGDAWISNNVPNGFMSRRYSDPIKEIYPILKDRNNVKSDFYLNFRIEPVKLEKTLDQKQINKVPEGMTGYDLHIIRV